MAFRPPSSIILPISTRMIRNSTLGSGPSTRTYVIGHSSDENDSLEDPFLIDLPHGQFAINSKRGIGYKKVNEDRVIVLPQFQFFSVIDGMGGPGDGEKASEILTDELSRMPSPNLAEIMHVEERVAARIQSECHTPESGVCFVMFWVKNSTLNICHVGDVKLALLDKDQKIKLETRDHTMLNAWIDQGYLSPEEALFHPQRHIITKALTGNEIPKPEMQQIALNYGDRLIVATDGLWDNFTIAEIIDMLSGSSPQEDTKMLMEKSLEKMQRPRSDNWEGSLLPKPDNISILIGDLTIR
ncbi:MAG: serine/threonine-protein phosphatase [SAR324 cluster bacterium]|nr:serine/threonine-protein phosphatase [SAR324 cluster bacterium]